MHASIYKYIRTNIHTYIQLEHAQESAKNSESERIRLEKALSQSCSTARDNASHVGSASHMPTDAESEGVRLEISTSPRLRPDDCKDDPDSVSDNVSHVCTDSDS
jgi:hypothetical protein